MESPVALRHALHAHPELSGGEAATAARLEEFFAPLEPDEIVRGIAGTGIAFCFGDERRGPTILLRSELDALPIREVNAVPYRSQVDGVSHKCGHDGHMAILSAAGLAIAKRRPTAGRVVLLFQPAEETGAGAAEVVGDPAFARIRPDRVFGLHNLPGYPLGHVVVRDGTFTCASRGMSIDLEGRTAHAAQPETGLSPAAALTEIVAFFDGLAGGPDAGGELAFATVVGAKLGERAFGVAPGAASVWVTLRSETDGTMATMVAHGEARVRAIARDAGLGVVIAYQDVFDATVNAKDAVDVVRRACDGLPVVEAREPFRWSEDFGRFTQVASGAFFALGAGEGTPALHDESYDFPDALIERGADVFLRIVDACFAENLS